MKTPRFSKALFLGITGGLLPFLLACGEPSEPTQETNDEPNLATAPEVTPPDPPVSPSSPTRIERKPASQGTFTVLAHNVQNLFDLDGVSAYNDYKPEYYGASQLQRKLANLTNLLARFGDGSGPDVVLLQEIELDRTAERDKSAAELLNEALREKGLGPYNLVEGRIKGQSLKDAPSIVCVTLSKFPVEEVCMHSLERARPILETTITIHGKPLVIFNNHWKSGASSASLEKVRLGNAQVLRKRIDALLAADPAVDVIVGGDLNSHYNQKQIHAAAMPKTGVNDVLLSHGDETAMPNPTRKLYNLWHELPPEKRGSDVWKGEWGTLMHLILSHGLYDDQGIQYVADSFRVVALPGFNVSKDTGVPLRWSNELGGYGASDHLPVLATFAPATKGVRPDVSEHDPSEPTAGRPIDFSRALANAPAFGPDSAKPENLDKVFRFKGRIVETKPLTFETEHGSIRAWSFHDAVRNRLFGAKNGEPLIGYGRLTRYRGNWQLMIETPAWLEE